MKKVDLVLIIAVIVGYASICFVWSLLLWLFWGLVNNLLGKGILVFATIALGLVLFDHVRLIYKTRKK